MRSVESLGHIFENGGFERKNSIGDIPIPTSVSAVRSFVEIVDYFRDFIPNNIWDPQLNSKKESFGENGFQRTLSQPFKFSRIRWYIDHHTSTGTVLRTIMDTILGAMLSMILDAI